MSGNKEIVDLPLIADPSNADLYVVKSDTDYRVRIGAVNGIPYLDGTGKVPSALLPAGSGGEANTASNVGAGSGLFKAKSGVDLQFKSLVAGTNVTFTVGADTLTINSSGGGGGGTGTVTSVAAGSGMNFSTFTTSGSVVLGTPGSTTLASTNAVTSNSHTHAFVPGGTTSQYIRGDGSLATFPTSVAAVSAGNGMSFSTITGTGPVTMGTPSNITLASTNSVSAGTHAHAFVPGGTTSQYIRGDASLATLNAAAVGVYVQSSDPGAVADGSLWIW